jgi:hypothetical protein
MKKISIRAQQAKGYRIGVATLLVTSAALVTAPAADASQDVGGGGHSLTASPAPTGQAERRTAAPSDSGTECDLAVWYVVYNPSINKPRGHQDTLVHWTPPSGPCER